MIIDSDAVRQQEGSSKCAGSPEGTAQDRTALVRGILSRIGDKWSVMVICSLGVRPLRFNELRRAVSGITQRMLTSTLRALERDGIVSRTVHPTTPPAVEYALTDVGHDLQCVLYSLATWADDHADTIHTARARYDERTRA
ncbi:helix-turn-helix transcriptional regulator [Streptomyces phaeochromogenes]|uniref:Helix-turn-helix transcriptional regulator n=1 Tax=Streptomyces phaeochromogenes TaxID=1923 RepID=A0ABZ1HQM7_STRPH|nr:helix-turn-helix domain-containing protein [Streptomyces phaeochromogenes]WSD19731.1 helix-turn-helix transcriptional regulator [Streptomyces phaeochromogenes]